MEVNSVMKKIIVIMGTVIGAIIGSEYANSVTVGLYTSQSAFSILTQSSTYYLSVAIGAFTGWLLSTMMAGKIVKGIQYVLKTMEQLPTRQLVSGTGGLLVGLSLC